MKKIAVIGAMMSEMEALIAQTGAVMGKYGFYESGDFAAAVCGIGKVNAASAARAAIIRFEPDAVISMGTSGGLDPSVPLCIPVICESTRYHDFSPLDALNRYPPYRTEFFCDAELTRECREAADRLGVDHISGRAVTGDRVICDSAEARRLFETGAVCADMESAAVAHVCLNCGVPFAVLRAVSDFADEDAMDEMERQVSRIGVKLAGIIREAFLK